MSNNVRFNLFAAFLLAVAIFSPLLDRVHPARAQFGGVQTWLGTGTVAAGGSSSTLTVSVHNIASLNDILGVPLRFLPSAQSVGPVSVTINIDNGGALTATMQRPTSNIGLQGLSNGELQTGVIAEMTYNGSILELKTVDLAPVGRTVEFRGTTAPLGALVEDGSCVSQTQYAALFSVIGTTYNAGAPVACTGGNFALPWSNGTVFNASDTQGVHTAGRITTATCSTPGAVGTLCGGQTHTLSTSELPVHTPSGSVSSSSTAPDGNSGAVCGVGTGATIGLCGQTANTISSSFTGNPIGSGAAHAILNTTLIGVRAIKY